MTSKRTKSEPVIAPAMESSVRLSLNIADLLDVSGEEWKPEAERRAVPTRDEELERINAAIHDMDVQRNEIIKAMKFQRNNVQRSAQTYFLLGAPFTGGSKRAPYLSWRRRQKRPESKNPVWINWKDWAGAVEAENVPADWLSWFNYITDIAINLNMLAKRNNSDLRVLRDTRDTLLQLRGEQI